jgi:hypothetical protein
MAVLARNRKGVGTEIMRVRVRARVVMHSTKRGVEAPQTMIVMLVCVKN